MDLFDKLALLGRRYEARRSPRTGSTRLSLEDVLMMFVGKAVLEMKVYHEGRAMQTTRPDAERKLKVSLLDGISEIHPPAGGWYEVYETAPTGDLAKARIVAMLPSGSAESELTILVGRRTLEHYFVEDPLISSFQQGHDLAGRHN